MTKDELANTFAEMASKCNELKISVENDELLVNGIEYLRFLDRFAEVRRLMNYVYTNLARYCLDSKHPVDKDGQMRLWRDE